MSVHRERALFTQSDYYCEQSIRINTVVDSAGAVVLHSPPHILCYGVRSTVHFALYVMIIVGSYNVIHFFP